MGQKSQSGICGGLSMLILTFCEIGESRQEGGSLVGIEGIDSTKGDLVE